MSGHELERRSEALKAAHEDHAPLSRPKPADDALALVAAIEVDVATLQGLRLDFMLAPDAVVATSAAAIATKLRRAEAVIARDPSAVSEQTATCFLERLDRALGALFVLARRQRIPMRETHVEEAFDLEDHVRVLLHFPAGRANRADHYYDADLVPISHATRAAPGAQEVASQLESGVAGAPQNRDELVVQITGFADDLARALDDGFFGAESIIKEPSRPHRPDVLELLAEIAAGFVQSSVTVAIGNLLGAGFRAADAALGASEHAGEHLTDVLLHGFRHLGTDAGKALGKLVPGAHHADGGGLSAKTIYLRAAKAKTSESMTRTRHRFDAFAGSLKRLPVDTLRALAQAFDSQMTAGVTRSFQDLLVREWVNFGKRAADHGEDVRDADARPSHPSKLDHLLAPYGVVHVRVDASGGDLRFRDAELPGVSDAVRANIREQPETLAQLGLFRAIELVPESSLAIGAQFELDPLGTIAQLPTSGEARSALARCARHQFGTTPSDGDVLAGIYAIVGVLSAIPASKIGTS